MANNKFNWQDINFIRLFVCLCILIVGLIDFFVAPEISFSFFYLFPILLIAMKQKSTKKDIFIICVLSALIWILGDMRPEKLNFRISVYIWNSLNKIAVMIFFGYILTSLKDSLLKQEQLERFDQLTGIYNRNSFVTAAADELDRAHRYNHLITLAFIDIEDFNQVNNKYGSETGDKILYIVTKTIRDNIRKSDIFARLSSDEFVLLFPQTDQEKAYTALEKLYTLLSERMFKNNWQVVFSIGATTFTKAPETVNEMIRISDEVMYSIKKKGSAAVDVKTV